MMNEGERFLEKIETPVQAPLELDLKEFCFGANRNDTKYELMGIINHFGKISGGHYTSNVKVDDKWYNFDDTKTSIIDNPVTPNAYVLFYINKNKEKTTQVLGLIHPKKEDLEKK